MIRVSLRRIRELGWRELLWITLAGLCLGAGIVGAILPLLPTTPFILLAAAAATRGSPRLAQWIETHPRFGPPLAHWREHRAITRRSKLTALAVITAGWVYSAYLLDDVRLAAALAVLLAGVALFLATRRTPPGS